MITNLLHLVLQLVSQVLGVLVLSMLCGIGWAGGCLLRRAYLLLLGSLHLRMLSSLLGLTLSLLQYSSLLIVRCLSLGLYMGHLSLRLSELRGASHHTLLHSCLLHVMSLLHLGKLLSILWVVHPIWHWLTLSHHLCLVHLRRGSHHAGMGTGLTHTLSRSSLPHYRRSLAHRWRILR